MSRLSWPHSLVTFSDVFKTSSSRSCVVYESGMSYKKKEMSITLYFMAEDYIKILGFLFRQSFRSGLNFIF